MAIRVIIKGRVQGVGFRAWAAREAQSRGLNGWVRNRRDGTVEALFAGEADALRHMLSACREGPSFAQVTGLEEAPADDPATPGFRTLPTAD